MPNSTNSEQLRWRFAILSFFCMLLGMAAHGGYNHLTGVTAWDINSFIAPILISPLIFGAFLSIIKSQLDILTGSLIAFQNGFFWKQIFEGLTPVLKVAGG